MLPCKCSFQIHIFKTPFTLVSPGGERTQVLHWSTFYLVKATSISLDYCNSLVTSTLPSTFYLLTSIFHTASSMKISQMCRSPAYCPSLASHNIGNQMQVLTLLFRPCSPGSEWSEPTCLLHLLCIPLPFNLYLLVTHTFSLFLKNTQLHPSADLGTCFPLCPQIFPWQPLLLIKGLSRMSSPPGLP